MTAAVPDRIIWAVNILDVKPDDSILEIGCGNGSAVFLVCDRLTTGSIMAIDRSAKMVASAKERNLENIRNGKAIVEQFALEEADFGSKSFSKIFAFNLNVFWMDPVSELRIVSGLLGPNGTFFIFHNPPPDSDLTEYTNAILKNLEANGFIADRAVVDQGVASLCIRSRPRINRQ
ncbi:MAG TPA: class I SAM-dependent methyltransferase [Pyrinomonadaceae bacterium]|jgi:SAM-dependent methyltransferase|nr:class I SAM-dependent methyltransferase [Pyrinomonadaceae bacterium]